MHPATAGPERAQGKAPRSGGHHYERQSSFVSGPSTKAGRRTRPLRPCHCPFTQLNEHLPIRPPRRHATTSSAPTSQWRSRLSTVWLCLFTLVYPYFPAHGPCGLVNSVFFFLLSPTNMPISASVPRACFPLQVQSSIFSTMGSQS